MAAAAVHDGDDVEVGNDVEYSEDEMCSIVSVDHVKNEGVTLLTSL